MNGASTRSKKNPEQRIGPVAAALLLAGLLLPAPATTVNWRTAPWFEVGERLTYNVYWGFIPVGESVATTEWVEEDGRELIAIRFRTRSNKVLSTIYPVDDLVEAVIDPDTFRPVRFTKRLSEGRYRCDETTYFDHEKGIARWTSKTRDREKEYPINEDTRDIISFMYYIRGKARYFQKGQEETFQVMADEKLYDLFVKPRGTDRVKLGSYGEVESVRFDPKAAFEGIFVRKGRISLWASNDDRRIITRVKAKTPFASVNIYLDKVEGGGDDHWVRDTSKKKRDGKGEEDVSSGNDDHD